MFCIEETAVNSTGGVSDTEDFILNYFPLDGCDNGMTHTAISGELMYWIVLTTARVRQCS
jgi:hypothetical protein